MFISRAKGLRENIPYTRMICTYVCDVSVKVTQQSPELKRKLNTISTLLIRTILHSEGLLHLQRCFITFYPYFFQT